MVSELLWALPWVGRPVHFVYCARHGTVYCVLEWLNTAKERNSPCFSCVVLVQCTSLLGGRDLSFSERAGRGFWQPQAESLREEETGAVLRGARRLLKSWRWLSDILYVMAKGKFSWDPEAAVCIWSTECFWHQSHWTF